MKTTVVTGMGAWTKDCNSLEEYNQHVANTKIESAKLVQNRADMTDYELLVNTPSKLVVRQKISKEYEGYVDPDLVLLNAFAWQIQYNFHGYTIDIIENKDEDCAEYPTRWLSLERLFWEYESYTYPFIVRSVLDNIDVKLKGFDFFLSSKGGSL